MTTAPHERAQDDANRLEDAPLRTADNRFNYHSLAFFGRVNASISHELKNVMAIISETSGLLGDISDMAASGTPVSPDMLKNCTESIVEEIQRGFTVIRQMNRFAHSIDAPFASVDLAELLDLVVNLAAYLSFAGKTTIVPCGEIRPVVVTSPFILQAVVYQGLVFAYKNTGAGADITLDIRQTNDTAFRIVYGGFSSSGFDGFPDSETRALADSIGLTIVFDRAADQLEIEIPKNMDEVVNV